MVEEGPKDLDAEVENLLMYGPSNLETGRLAKVSLVGSGMLVS